MAADGRERKIQKRSVRSKCHALADTSLVGGEFLDFLDHGLGSAGLADWRQAFLPRKKSRLTPGAREYFFVNLFYKFFSDSRPASINFD